MIPATAVLLSDRASEVLLALENSPTPKAQAIAPKARAFKPLLLVDCLHGELVRKASIPRSLKEAYGLENLYVEDLPDFWRMLYTVAKHDGRRVVVVVEIVSHKEYRRWFPGRRHGKASNP
jgi:hypothetical protein